MSIERSASDVGSRAFIFLVASSLLFLCLPAFGQAAVGKQSANRLQAQTAKEPEESVAIVEVGGATNWNIKDGTARFAPNLAAEITPIEGWLELEAGVSPLYTHKSTEWDTDLLFKEALDALTKGRVHAGDRPAVDLPQAKWEDCKFDRRRVSGRLYVLADRQTPLRLVS